MVVVVVVIVVVANSDDFDICQKLRRKRVGWGLFIYFVFYK